MRATERDMLHDVRPCGNQSARGFSVQVARQKLQYPVSSPNGPCGLGGGSRNGKTSLDREQGTANSTRPSITSEQAFYDWLSATLATERALLRQKENKR